MSDIVKRLRNPIRIKTDYGLELDRREAADEIVSLRSRLAEVESQNRVMWDVASDREAQLAEAEARHQRVMAVIRPFCAKYAPDLLAEFDAAVADSATHREDDSHV